MPALASLLPFLSPFLLSPTHLGAGTWRLNSASLELFRANVLCSCACAAGTRWQRLHRSCYQCRGSGPSVRRLLCRAPLMRGAWPRLQPKTPFRMSICYSAWIKVLLMWTRSGLHRRPCSPLPGAEPQPSCGSSPTLPRCEAGAAGGGSYYQ